MQASAEDFQAMKFVMQAIKSVMQAMKWAMSPTTANFQTRTKVIQANSTYLRIRAEAK
ncbi:MAG TPA: hypothetical protein VK157_09345 [Phycisphaerales bacterium]|nr:hypothetical protein [Phycisphaerales bacterium]